MTKAAKAAKAAKATSAGLRVSPKQLKELAGRIGDIRGQLEQIPTAEQLAHYKQSMSAQLFGIQGELEQAAT